MIHRTWIVLVAFMVAACASAGPIISGTDASTTSSSLTASSSTTASSSPNSSGTTAVEPYRSVGSQSADSSDDPGNEGVQRISAPIDRVTVGRVDGRAVLVDGNGEPLQLRGVNRSGTEYACAQGWAIHDTGVGEEPEVVLGRLIDVMVSWEVNAVRVPLNEHCWLDRNGVRDGLGGEAYRAEIVRFVGNLRARGIAVVLGLMWGDAGGQLGLRQPQMANRDHSVDMWVSVAETFRDDGGILYELFGEPSIDDWSCWRDGCDIDGYPVAGMQSMVDAVRSTGSTQGVIVSGLRFANDLSRWVEFAPVDPAEQLIAGFHLYNFNACIDVECWDAEIAPITSVAPVVTSELGEDLCTGEFLRTYLDWADSQGLAYLAWGFNSQDSCSRGPALLARSDGTTTTTGTIFRDHLRARADS